MSSKTVTNQDVIEAAMYLIKEERKSPTAARIHQCIGYGSLTTIQKHMDSVWEHVSETLNHWDEHPEIPAPVFEAARNMWDASVRHQTETAGAMLSKAEELHQEVQKKEKELKDRLSMLSTRNKELEQENKTVIEERGIYLARLNETDELLEGKERKIQSLLKELKEKEKTTSDLGDEVKVLNFQISKMNEENKDMREQHASEISIAKDTENRLRVSRNQLQEKMTNKENEAKEVISDLKSQVASLKASNKASESENKRLSVLLDKKSGELEKADKKAEEALLKVQSDKDKLSQTIITMKDQIASEKLLLSEVKSDLKHAEKQISSLQKEKDEAKSELKSYINQMMAKKA